MQVKLNGKPLILASGPTTLVDFLIVQGLDPSLTGIAVAVNLSVIPRSDWAETMVREGDEVEVIAALQGG